tara:strand:- start:362 stop:613 length:252 start_codon:yes stop_codon:yes gene_type:complete
MPSEHMFRFAVRRQNEERNKGKNNKNAPTKTATGVQPSEVAQETGAAAPDTTTETEGARDKADKPSAQPQTPKRKSKALKSFF